jgi:hypothetical protein
VNDVVYGLYHDIWYRRYNYHFISATLLNSEIPRFMILNLNCNNNYSWTMCCKRYGML